MKATIPAVYRNIKTGKYYHTIHHVINQTNKDEGNVMVMYHNNGEYYYVRELKEFLKKFKLVGE